jgi:hypothetical protein
MSFSSKTTIIYGAAKNCCLEAAYDENVITQKSSPITRRSGECHLGIEVHLDQASGCPTAAPSALWKSLDLGLHEAMSSSTVAPACLQGSAMIRVMTGGNT